MKKKLFLFTLMLSLLVCVLAISVSAASTNEFGAVENIPGIDLTGMSEDANARVVLFDGAQYHTYPSQYIVTNNGTFTYDFSKITAKGYNYDVNSVIRIEIPNTVTAVPTDGGSNPLTRYNVIEIYFPEDSTITKFSYGCFANSPKLQKINVPKSVTELNTYTFYNSKAIVEINFHEESPITTIPANTFKGCSGLLSLTLPNSVTTIAERSLDFGQNQVITELRLSANLVDFGGYHFAWNQYKDKIFRIYAPAAFLANETEITSPIYDKQGTFTTYPSSMYSVCIYFCGTKAQLDALIEKSTYDKFTNANLVKYDPSKSDTEYGALNTWTVVYDYNACQAFYDGVHVEEVEDNNPCILSSCKNCTYENQYIGNESTHNFDSEYAYSNGFNALGSKISFCKNANCLYCKDNEPLVEELSPIFYDFKYSRKVSDGFGLAMFYKVDRTALSVYEENTGKTVSYGVIATAKNNVTVNEDITNPLDNNGNTSASHIITANVTENAPSSVELVIKGSLADWESVKDVEFYILGYAFDTNGVLQYFHTSSSSMIKDLTTFKFQDA